MIGLTTHQRSLAAEVLKSRKRDLFMARYNAAHRSAETSVCAIAQEFETPEVTFTSLRWKGVLHATPEDPPHFKLPSARDWYRLVLSNPAVAVALMAPDNRKKLQDNLTLLADWRPPTAQEREALFQPGEQVRRHTARSP